MYFVGYFITKSLCFDEVFFEEIPTFTATFFLLLRCGTETESYPIHQKGTIIYTGGGSTVARPCFGVEVGGSGMAESVAAKQRVRKEQSWHWHGHGHGSHQRGER